MSYTAIPTDALPAVLKIVSDAEQQLTKIAGLPVKIKLNADVHVLSVAAIQTLVCDHFNVTFSQIISKSRKDKYVMARHCFLYLCWYYFPDEPDEKFAAIVNRERTSAIHARANIKKLLATDANIKRIITTIQKQLLQ